MKEAQNVNERIAARVRELRARQKLSLDALAGKSGVSRSMISLIERGESSPTAVILEKLAAALGATLASLFEAPAANRPTGPVSRRKEQVEWRDPASEYVRRNISPAGAPRGMQIVEVHFPAGGRVAFETVGWEVRLFHQIWILEGEMEITLGEERHRLKEGDCLAMQLDRAPMFHNPTRKPARYAVFVVAETSSRRASNRGNSH